MVVDVVATVILVVGVCEIVVASVAVAARRTCVDIVAVVVFAADVVVVIEEVKVVNKRLCKSSGRWCGRGR